MIFRTDRKRLPWRVERLARPDRRRAAQATTAGSAASPLGGRPTELAFAPDGKTLYVANYLADAVQVVDAEAAKLVRTIPLGGPEDALAGPPGRDPLPRRRRGRSTSGTAATPATATATPTASTSTR